MSSLKYLLKREWSMGNGQCPDCCGVPKSWLGHPLYLDGSGIGHEPKCSLAAAIAGAGGKPLYIGKFKPKIQYETCLVSAGELNPGMFFHSTQVKGSNPEARARMVESNKEFEKKMNKIFWDACFPSTSEAVKNES